MDSHIQVPKEVFMEFVNDKHYYFKYDVLTNKVKKAFPKSTFTEQGYYSDKMESALNKQIESPLKRLLERAKTLQNEQAVFTIDSELIDLGWIYICSLLARNPTLHKTYSSHLVYGRFFMTPQQQHDSAVSSGIQIAGKWINDQNYDFSFMINHTSTPFMIPTRGIIECAINDIGCLVVPLTPYCAILLIEQGKSIHPNMPKHIVLDILPGDDARINFFNYQALQKQINDGVGCVVCTERHLLDDSLRQLGIIPKHAKAENSTQPGILD